jgi:hypothetical protein
MRLGLLLALAIAAGCYESHTRDGSEGDAGPRVCGGCTGDPGDRVHFRTTSEGWPVRWDTSAGCIRATYDPALPPARVTELQRHIANVNAIPCASLCFSDPSAGARPDVFREPSLTERRLHVSIVDGLDGAILTTLFIDECTGKLFYALIEIDRVSLPTIDAQDLARMIARSTGLDRPDGSRLDTMLLMALEPTADDRQALCAMYGDPPYCD